MKIQQVTLADPVTETDTVVVIDVLRAFTTAAFAFARGVREIFIVRTVDEAFALRESMTGSFVSGEVDGVIVPGFELGNSPAELEAFKVVGRDMIQRTTAGTQGVARYRDAKNVFAASFVCANATAQEIRVLNPSSVTFVVTGKRGGVDGDEDAACADYLSDVLTGRNPDVAEYTARIERSSWGRQFGDPAKPHFPIADIPLCADANRFDFAMRLEKRGELSVLKQFRSQA